MFNIATSKSIESRKRESKLARDKRLNCEQKTERNGFFAYTHISLYKSAKIFVRRFDLIQVIFAMFHLIAKYLFLTLCVFLPHFTYATYRKWFPLKKQPHLLCIVAVAEIYPWSLSPGRLKSFCIWFLSLHLIFPEIKSMRHAHGAHASKVYLKVKSHTHQMNRSPKRSDVGVAKHNSIKKCSEIGCFLCLC